jgi:hypothetical protein
VVTAAPGVALCPTPVVFGVGLACASVGRG